MSNNSIVPKSSWQITTLYKADVRTISDYKGILNLTNSSGLNSQNFLRAGIYNPHFFIYVSKDVPSLRLYIMRGTTFIFSYSLRNVSEDITNPVYKRDLNGDSIFYVKCTANRDISVNLNYGDDISVLTNYSKYFLTATMNFNFGELENESIEILQPQFNICVSGEDYTGIGLTLPNEDKSIEQGVSDGYLTSYLILGVLNRIDETDIIQNLTSSIENIDKRNFYKGISFTGCGLEEYENNKSIIPIDFNYDIKGDVYYNLGDLKIKTFRGNYLNNKMYPWYYLYNQTNINKIGEYDKGFNQLTDITELEDFTAFTIDDTEKNKILQLGKNGSYKNGVIYSIVYIDIKETINDSSTDDTTIITDKVNIDIKNNIKHINFYEFGENIIEDGVGFVNENSTFSSQIQSIEKMFNKNLDVFSVNSDSEIRERKNTNCIIPIDISKENQERLYNIIANKDIFSRLYSKLLNENDATDDISKSHTYIPVCISIRRIKFNEDYTDFNYDYGNSERVVNSTNILYMLEIEKNINTITTQGSNLIIPSVDYVYSIEE